MMSTIRILSCSTSYLARNSLSQTQKTIISSFLPAGVITSNREFSSARSQHILTCPISYQLRFPAAKPSTSVYDLTKHLSNSFSTKPKPIVPDEKDKDCKAAEFKTDVDEQIFGDCSNLTQFGKFKLMYKKYWYVLLPVHVVTSISWIVGFYYLSKSGVDIPSALQYIHLSESIIEKFKHSDMGHYAIAYLCYKVITPIRYAVSLGMTTVSIKRLVFAGYIKPMPTKKELIEMYEQNKKDRAKRKENDAKTP